MSGYVPTGGLGNASYNHVKTTLKCAEETMADDIVESMKNSQTATVDDGSEVIGQASDDGREFVAHLKNVPILPGSVRIIIDDFGEPTPNYDNGNGLILGTRHLNGVVDYNFGLLKLNLSPRAHGKTVRAIYATDFSTNVDIATLAEAPVKPPKNVLMRVKNWIKGIE